MRTADIRPGSSRARRTVMSRPEAPNGGPPALRTRRSRSSIARALHAVVPPIVALAPRRGVGPSRRPPGERWASMAHLPPTPLPPRPLPPRRGEGGGEVARHLAGRMHHSSKKLPRVRRSPSQHLPNREKGARLKPTMSRSLVRLRRAAWRLARVLVPRVEVCAWWAVLPVLCTPAPHPCCVCCAKECGAGAVPLSAAARCVGRRRPAVRRWARPCCCRCGDGAGSAPKPRPPHHLARRAQVSRSCAPAACAATCCWQRAARRARGRGARWWARCWSLRAGRSRCRCSPCVPP